MRIVIISDIHGNLEALAALKRQLGEITNIQGMVLLGDLIDYGPHSNEVIELIKELSYPVLCNIWGNHEEAIVFEKYVNFSSERGRQCARYTRSQLSENTKNYLMQEMLGKGRYEFDICGKKCLAVHGSLEDEYWKGIFPWDDLEEYGRYDYVFSGHTHLPHFFEKYYPKEDGLHRNRKKTVFINPGSVGQPRNLNPMAQCALLDLDKEDFVMIKCSYNIGREQKAFSAKVDAFYKNRLEYGI